MPRKNPTGLLLLYGSVALSLLVLLTPFVFVVAWSTMGTPVLGKFAHLSTRWFEALMFSNEWRTGLVVSLTCSFAAVAPAIVVAFSAAFSAREQSKNVGAVNVFYLAPLFVPTAVYSIVLVSAWGFRSLPDYVIYCLGLYVIILPSCYIVAVSGLKASLVQQLQAARSMGARPAECFLRIYLPRQRSTAIVCFVLSMAVAMDEVVVPLAVLHAPPHPLSMLLYQQMMTEMTPVPAAASLLLILICLGAALSYAAVHRVVRRWRHRTWL